MCLLMNDDERFLTEFMGVLERRSVMGLMELSLRSFRL